MPTQEEVQTEIEEEILIHLDNAMDMKLELSEEDSSYDLIYISGKLAKCSTYLERLSDIMLMLTKRSLAIIKLERAHSSLLRFKEIDLKGSDIYQNLDRFEKSLWLANQLRDERSAVEKWITLRRMVSEVKEAVGERAGTMKRLDSDVRLHSKLYEAKVAAGATSPTAFTGAKTDEMDLA